MKGNPSHFLFGRFWLQTEMMVLTINSNSRFKLHLMQTNEWCPSLHPVYDLTWPASLCIAKQRWAHLNEGRYCIKLFNMKSCPNDWWQPIGVSPSSFNYFNLISEKSCQFGVAESSKYYNTHDAQLPFRWRKASERWLKAATNSKRFTIAVVNKTRCHSCWIHPNWSKIWK